MAEPAKQKDKLYTLRGVEIFASGTWNGSKFSEKDLDEMAANASKVGFAIPIKQGHTKDPGAPALGWVENLRRKGSKLVADFVSLPEKVATAIKGRSYDAVSAEIFRDLKRNGDTFRLALKGVALLGADVPAVSNLTPLHKLVEFSEDEYEAIDEFKTELPATDEPGEETEDMADKSKEELEAASARIKELEAKIAEFEQEKPDVLKFEESDEYKQMTAKLIALEESQRRAKAEKFAQKCVIPALRPMVEHLFTIAGKADAEMKFSVGEGDEAKELDPVATVGALVDQLNGIAKEAFAEATTTKTDLPEGPAAEDEFAASDELDKKVKEYISTNPEASYEQAVTAVFSDPKNAALVEAYAN